MKVGIHLGMFNRRCFITNLVLIILNWLNFKQIATWALALQMDQSQWSVILAQLQPKEMEMLQVQEVLDPENIFSLPSPPPPSSSHCLSLQTQDNHIKGACSSSLS